jgi:uncharacterized protein with PIN domain
MKPRRCRACVGVILKSARERVNNALDESRIDEEEKFLEDLQAKRDKANISDGIVEDE